MRTLVPGGYVIENESNPHQFAEHFNVWVTKNGQQVAYAEFTPVMEYPVDESGDDIYEPYVDEDGVKRWTRASRIASLKGWRVEVSPEHRRRGLATKMYRHARRAYGLPIVAGDFQTPEGAAFLEGRRSR